MKETARLAAVVVLGLLVLVAAGYWILSEEGSTPGPVGFSELEAAGLATADGSEPGPTDRTSSPGQDETLERRIAPAALADESEPESAQAPDGVRDPQGRDDVGLRGRVIDEFGNPVAGARVIARRERGRFVFWSSPRPGEGVVTDVEGRFEVRGLRPRTSYSLLADHPDYQQATRAKVVTGDTIRDVEDVVIETGAAITGRVVGPDGAAVAGATVWSSTSGSGEFDFVIDDWGDGGVLPTGRRSVKTDDEGVFRLGGLAPGQVTLRAGKAGFSRARSETLEMVKGQMITGLLLGLGPGSAIAGRVVDSAGRPVAQAQIKLDSFGGLMNSEEKSDPPEIRSDANGLFRIEGITDARHQLTVEAPGFSTYHKWNVKAGAEDLEIVLARAGTIKGRVVEAAGGAPVKGFKVWASRGDGFAPSRSHDNQDEDGEENDTFELTELRAGSYRVAVEAEGFGRAFSEPVELGEGETLEGLVISLRPGAVLAGKVVATADGKPIEGAKVRLKSVSPPGEGSVGEIQGLPVEFFGGDQAVPWEMPGRGYTGRAETDSKGHFEIIGIPAGDYKLSVSRETYARFGPDAMTLAAGERHESLAIELLQGGVATGEVRDLEGLAVPGETIRVRGPLPDVKSATTGKTGPDGVYRIEHLAAGEYEISRGGENSPFIFGEAMISLGPSGKPPADNTAEHIVIREGEITRHDFSDVTLGQISGRILAAAGPVGEARVQLLSSKSRSRFGFGLGRAPSTKSDARGRYELERITPGDYRLSVQVPSAPIPYQEKITITQGAQTLDVRLPGGRIRGRIVAEHDSSPVTGARVSLNSKSGASEVTTSTISYQVAFAAEDGNGAMLSLSGGSSGVKPVLTDDDGYYSLEYVPAGTYELAFNHPGYVPADPVEIELAEDQVKTGVNAKARAAVQITGKVTSSFTGKPLGMLVVELSREDGFHSANFVQDDGLFRFKGLTPGTYILKAHEEGYQPFEKTIVAETGGEFEVPVALSPK